MGKHLVLAGGGHAHLLLLSRLAEITSRGHRVTLVSPDDYHYYSGMGPGLLGGSYRPEEVRFNVAAMARRGGARFLSGEVVAVDPHRRILQLRGGQEFAYDLVSFNTGSSVPLEGLGEPGPQLVPVKPIVNLLRARQAILAQGGERPLGLVVAGGGAAGVELCGNLWRLGRQTRRPLEITLVAGRALLKTFAPRLRRLARHSLEGRRIRILEGQRVVAARPGEATLSGGERLRAEILFVAVGVRPSPIFARSALATGPEGGLLVNGYLQALDHPEIFGGGDCISFAPRPLPKVGVYAVRQNPVLFHNLVAALEDRPLQAFEPQRDHLLILNLGNGRGVLGRGPLSFDGRLPFYLKDRIDRSFMQRYQLCGERQGNAEIFSREGH